VTGVKFIYIVQAEGHHSRKGPGANLAERRKVGGSPGLIRPVRHKEAIERRISLRWLFIPTSFPIDAEAYRVFYPDLSTECDVDRGSHVRAIGWLCKDHPFPTGPVPREFLTALRAHVQSAWQPVGMFGVHFCEFCPDPRPGKGRIGGSGNVWVPTLSVVYVAPELIVHYIEVHSYRPPEEFIAAVLGCPEQDSPAFHELLRGLPNAGWPNLNRKPRRTDGGAR
jgi:hypothetical protein